MILSNLHLGYESVNKTSIQYNYIIEYSVIFCKVVIDINGGNLNQCVMKCDPPPPTEA